MRKSVLKIFLVGYVLLNLFLLVALVVYRAATGAPSWEEGHKRGERETIRVVVEESYNGRLSSDGIAMPFEAFDTTEKILEACGFKVVDAKAEHYDVSLSLKIRGKAISADYESRTYYSSASSEGEIEVQLADGRTYRREFAGLKAPPSSFSFRPSFFSRPPYDTPNDAPFLGTVWEPGSLVYQLVDLVGEWRGQEALTPLLTYSDWRASWQADIVREAARETKLRIQQKRR